MGRKAGPRLIFDVDGAHIEVGRGANLDARAGCGNSIDIAAADELWRLVRKPAKAAESFNVNVRTVLKRNGVSGADEKRLFPDIVGRGQICVVELRFDGQTPGKIKVSEYREALNVVEAIV